MLAHHEDLLIDLEGGRCETEQLIFPVSRFCIRRKIMDGSHSKIHLTQR